MQSFVHDQIASLREVLQTDVAREWLLARMRPQVRHEVTGAHDLLEAARTLEHLAFGSLTCMRSGGLRRHGGRYAPMGGGAACAGGDGRRCQREVRQADQTGKCGRQR